MEGCSHLPCEKYAVENQVREGGQSSFQYWFECECELAMEWSKSDERQEVGNQDSGVGFETENEGGTRVGGLQEKNFERDESKVEKDEAASDDREEC